MTGSLCFIYFKNLYALQDTFVLLRCFDVIIGTVTICLSTE